MRWIRSLWRRAAAMQRRVAETILRPDAVTLAYRPAGTPEPPPSSLADLG